MCRNTYWWNFFQSKTMDIRNGRSDLIFVVFLPHPSDTSEGMTTRSNLPNLGDVFTDSARYIPRPSNMFLSCMVTEISTWTLNLTLFTGAWNVGRNDLLSVRCCQSPKDASLCKVSWLYIAQYLIYHTCVDVCRQRRRRWRGRRG